MLNLNFQNGTTPALNARNMNAIVESINTLGYAVGGPNVASTVSAMTDTSKVYVYTGSETGYTAGNWYYYNGSAWVSGGVYQAAAVETDTTLTMPGEPADAKATGDAIADLKSAIDKEAADTNEDLYDLTDNLLDITVGSSWYSHNYKGSQEYTIHSEIFPVSVGETYYCSIKNVDSEKFGSDFRLIVNILDSNGNIVDTKNSYASDYTTEIRSFTITSGQTSIVANLSTRSISKPINVEDIILSDMVPYLGKSAVTGTYIYPKYKSPKAEMQREISKNASALRENPNWANGTIDSNGDIYYRADRINSGKIEANMQLIECINNYNGLIAYYNSEGAKISVGSFTKNLFVNRSDFPSGTAFIAIAINNGTSTINPSEGENCIILYSVDVIAKEDKPSFSNFPYVIGSTNQICRLGWKPYANDTPPEQSLASYALAYQKGCRIMLCDVRATQDGTLVCFHDSDLGAELSRNMVRHTDGSTLSNEEKAQTIVSMTITQLDEYDFGIYKGNQYAGTKILRLDDFLKWCSMANCYPMLETKIELTQTQIQQIAGMCKKYQLMKRIIVADGYGIPADRKQWWVTNFPECISVIRGGSSMYSNCINDAQTFVSAGIETYISFTSTTDITDARCAEMAVAGVGVEYSEVESLSQMDTFWSNGFASKVRMIVSSYINIQEYINEKIGI